MLGNQDQRDKQLELLNDSLLRGVGKGIHSISEEAGIHEASSSHQQLQALGRYLSILKSCIVKLEAESDFVGATALRGHVQEQQEVLHASLANKRQTESQKNEEHLASVAQWEECSHVQDWNSLVYSIRRHFRNRRAILRADQAVKLAQLQERKASVHKCTGQLTPKATPAELELEVQMKALVKGGRVAEAVKLQPQVVRNHKAAVQRWETLKQLTFESAVDKMNAQYCHMVTCCKKAEHSSLQFAHACRQQDTARMHSSHAIRRQRFSASEHRSSSKRVLSGWPHFPPGVPQIPGDVEVGPVVPSAAQLSRSRSSSSAVSSCNRSKLSLFPEHTSKPPSAATFRPATADAQPHAGSSRSRAATSGDYMPRPSSVLGSVRPKSVCDRVIGRIQNKDLWRLSFGCDGPQGVCVLQSATSLAVDQRYELV